MIAYFLYLSLLFISIYYLYPVAAKLVLVVLLEVLSWKYLLPPDQQTRLLRELKKPRVIASLLLLHIIYIVLLANQ